MIKESHNYDHNHSHTDLTDSKSIKIAFFLNLSFSIIEIFGALVSNSITLYSNAIHDIGDSVILFFSILLEKKSANPRSNKYTYGYRRFAMLSNLLNCLILIIGALIIYKGAITRFGAPELVNGEIMLGVSVLGIIINGIGSYKLKSGDVKNHHSLYLNLLSDVIGWISILFSSLMILLFNITIFDSIFSLLLATWLLYNGIKESKTVIYQLMQAVPTDIDIDNILDFILKQNKIIDVHDFHIWDLDGTDYISSFHIVFEKDTPLQEMMQTKELLKVKLEDLKINHSTIEIDTYNQAIVNGELVEKKCNDC